MTFVLAKISLKLGFTKMLSKILAETKFVQNVLTTLNSNEQILVKQKHFSSINTPNMFFKIIKQICYFFCKIM